MKVVLCDECNKDFVIEAKEEEVRDAIFKVYFACPHCRKEYISYYTNVLIKQKQRRIRNIHEDYHRAVRVKDNQKANRLLKQHNKLYKNIGKDMDRLRKRVEGE